MSFLWGVLIGIMVAAPIGPVNVFCIQRTLNRGWLQGLVPGFGAVMGDGLFAFAAAFGLTGLMHLVTLHQVLLQFIGAVFLFGMAVHTWRSAPHLDASRALPAQPLRTVTATFLLTITNPATLFGFIAIFAGTGVVSVPDDYHNSGQIVLGVVTGSGLWWLALCFGIGHFHGKLEDPHLKLINHTTAALVFGSGVFFLSRAVMRLLAGL